MAGPMTTFSLLTDGPALSGAGVIIGRAQPVQPIGEWGDWGWLLPAGVAVLIIVYFLWRRSRRRRGLTTHLGIVPRISGNFMSAGQSSSKQGAYPLLDQGTRPTTRQSMGVLLDGSLPVRAGTVAELNAGIEQIITRDPAFNSDAFMRDALSSFMALNAAWTDGRADTDPRVASEEIGRKMADQLADDLTSGRHLRFEGLLVRHQNLVGAEAARSVDTIVVRFSVESSAALVDADGRVLAGNPSVFPWAEDWTFQRSNESATVTTDGRWVVSRIDLLPSWEQAMATLPR